MAGVDQEQTWIEQSRQGDHAAFENLMKSHQRMIYAVAYRMTGSMPDAEDLTQEAFIRAFRQLSSFRGDAKFSSWLCRVAMNACLNWRQRESRRDEVHRKWADDALPESGAPAVEESTPANTATVQAALERLPAPQRAAIILTVYDEMNHAEAARVLGCSEATVSWRVFAARAKLKRWLKGRQPEQ
jgi:RNA polymerase sigma-70 factor (ECF subfamily)